MLAKKSLPQSYPSLNTSLAKIQTQKYVIEKMLLAQPKKESFKKHGAEH